MSCRGSSPDRSLARASAFSISRRVSKNSEGSVSFCSECQHYTGALIVAAAACLEKRLEQTKRREPAQTHVRCLISKPRGTHDSNLAKADSRNALPCATNIVSVFASALERTDVIATICRLSLDVRNHLRAESIISHLSIFAHMFGFACKNACDTESARCFKSSGISCCTKSVVCLTASINGVDRCLSTGLSMSYYRGTIRSGENIHARCVTLSMNMMSISSQARAMRYGMSENFRPVTTVSRMSAKSAPIKHETGASFS